jgi:iron complex outermembrane recepter protein
MSLIQRAPAWGACILGSLLWMVVVGHAQEPAQLSGSVVDATGLPLVGATVAIQGAAEMVAKTDGKGQFIFQSLPAGEYQLTASLADFGPARRMARLSSGEKASVSLTLTPLFLEQTVVTASKIGATDVQTTPIAISVLRGAELARMQDHTIEQIAGRAPAVSFSQNTGLAQLTIRGIGTNAVFAGSDPSSAVYIDGVYLARPGMVLADFLDIDRIEVLRGPQGTLYGRNSLGGAINLVTKPPTDDVEASARVGVGTQGTFRAEARASGPIIRDRLLGSGAILRGVRAGPVRDLEHPEHRLGGEDVVGARGQLRVIFNPRTELHVSADMTHSDPPPIYYSKILAVKPGFDVDNPAGFYDVRASFPAEGHTFQSGASARFALDLTPSIRLTSLSAFRKLDFDVIVDGDASELDLDISRVHELQHQISHEITVASRKPRLTWIGGVFLFDETDSEPSSTVVPEPRLEFRLDPRVDANANAVFGQATVAVTPRLSATAGLRYTHERKEIENAGGLYAADAPFNLLSDSYRYTDAIAHDAWTPKFVLEVRARDHVLAYASVTRGFKSGGFNATSTAAGRGYGPEWAWSYEGGVKTVSRDGRTRVSVAAFYTDYTDLQVQTPITTSLLDVSNAAAATIHGVEVEATTLLRDTVQVGGHVGWLDARYDRYLAVGPGGLSVDAAGHRLNNAPEWSGRTWVDWRVTTGSMGTLSFRADSTWKSTVFYTPFNDRIQQQGSFGLLDVSAEFGPRQRRWSIVTYVRNLTNEDYITGSNSAPQPAIGGRPGDPRQVGLQFVIGR